MKDLNTLFKRELEKLAHEINAYPEDHQLWQVIPGITNPGGNLALHLCGNLREFIGRQLGNIPYQRNRAYEFGATGVHRQEIIDEIHTTIEAVSQTLIHFDPQRLPDPYPQEVFGFSMSNEYFLFHLLAHLNYHLGQVNYHRRIISGKNQL